MTLGDFVRAYRTEHNMSMQEFADRCGLSKAYISILERNINPASGKPPIPSLETIQAVARVIGIDFNNILSALNRDQEVALETSDAVPPPMPLKKKPIPVSEDGLSEEENQVLGAVRGLTPAQQAALVAFLKTILEQDR